MKNALGEQERDIYQGERSKLGLESAYIPTAEIGDVPHKRSRTEAI